MPVLRHSFYQSLQENMDSGHALTLLARAVGCSPSNFELAGTKDKRAVTVQQVTAYKA